METLQKLTQEQLDEIKDLAKTKNLKEIASHFGMSKLSFRMLRREQPEITTIYEGTPKDKVRTEYTPEELIEIEKMMEVLSMTAVVKKLGISMPILTKARNQHPELEAALTRGMENRSSDFNHLIRVKKKEEKAAIAETQIEQKNNNVKKSKQKEESLFTKAPEDISPEEALQRFYKLKEDAKRKRLFKL